MNLGMNQLYFKCGPTANLIAIFLVACYELNIIFLRFVLLKKKKICKISLYFDVPCHIEFT